MTVYEHDVSLWGYVHMTVYEHDVNNTQEILYRTVDAARCVHDLHALRKVTRFRDKQVTICVQAERAHFGHSLT